MDRLKLVRRGWLTVASSDAILTVVGIALRPYAKEANPFLRPVIETWGLEVFALLAACAIASLFYLSKSRKWLAIPLGIWGAASAVTCALWLALFVVGYCPLCR